MVFLRNQDRCGSGSRGCILIILKRCWVVALFAFHGILQLNSCRHNPRFCSARHYRAANGNQLSPRPCICYTNSNLGLYNSSLLSGSTLGIMSGMCAVSINRLLARSDFCKCSRKGIWFSVKLLCSTSPACNCIIG